jgi:hypothetical protein
MIRFTNPSSLYINLVSLVIRPKMTANQTRIEPFTKEERDKIIEVREMLWRIALQTLVEAPEWDTISEAIKQLNKLIRGDY